MTEEQKGSNCTFMDRTVKRDWHAAWVHRWDLNIARYRAHCLRGWFTSGGAIAPSVCLL